MPVLQIFPSECLSVTRNEGMLIRRQKECLNECLSLMGNEENLIRTFTYTNLTQPNL